MMELVNELYAFSEQTLTGAPGKRGDEDVEHAGEAERRETICVVRESVEALVRMLAPFAPHTAEELWDRYGHGDGLGRASWPRFDPDVARAEEVVIPVQVNGKVRSRIAASPDAADAELEQLALADPGVQPYLKDREVTKVVVARGRLVSIVVR
jgi:leucyl-tRNA synthetase